jgi:hypothetical protein
LIAPEALNMFEPISQLQQLRRRALYVREVCHGWAKADAPALHAQGALVAWRISRVVSGWLIGHPNEQFHPTRSPVFALALACGSLAVRASHWSEMARRRWLSTQLRALARECADIRAVTSSVIINEMLARHQPSLLALERVVAPVSEPALQRGTRALQKRSFDAENWPFLSI